MIECPEPGIYFDIPEDDYHAWPAMSQSQLKPLEKSPLHFKQNQDKPMKRTKAMEFGAICHDLILRPTIFGEKYILSENCKKPIGSGDRKGQPCGLSGTWNLGSDWFCGKHKPQGAQCPEHAITIEQSSRARRLRDTLMENDVAAEVLGGPGQTEVSMVWDDPKTGIRCKARIDRVGTYRKYSIFLDIKKTVDAGPWKFGYQAAQLGYHIQGGFYLNGSNILTPDVQRRYVILAFEENDPFHFGTYELDEPDILKVQGKIRSLMARLKELNTADEPLYPSYVPQGIEILPLPNFA